MAGARKKSSEPAPGGRIPLQYAATGADADLIDELIAMGQDPNVQDGSSWSPLHFAAQRRSLIAATTLVERGADVNRTDRHGNGPFKPKMPFFIERRSSFTG